MSAQLAEPAPAHHVALLRVVLVALAYWATGRLGLAIPYFDAYITLVWLPTGIALAALLRWGPVMGIGVWLGAALVNLSVGGTLGMAVLLATGNTAGPALAAYALRRSGFRPALSRRTDVVQFVLIGAVAGMLVTATSGVMVLALFGVVTWDRFASAWLVWWGGDLVGVLLAGVPLLAFSRDALRRAVRGWPGVESVVVFSVAAVSGWLLFFGAFTPRETAQLLTAPLLFVPYALVVWLAMRHGLLAASVLLLMVGILAAAGTAGLQGPFIAAPAHAGLVELWSYIATLTIINLLVCALLAESAVSRRRMSALFENAREGILLARPGGTILDANPAACALFGRTVEQLRACGRAGVVDPHDHRFDLLRERRRTNGSASGVASFIRGDGSSFEAEISMTAHVDEQGEALTHVVLRDVTDRQAAMAALARSEEWLQRALEGGELGLWDLDLLTQENRSNARWSEMLGYGPGEVPATQKGFVDLVHPDDREPLARMFSEHCAGRRDKLEIEIRMRHKDGRWRWILDKGKVTQRAADGTPLRAIGTHMDITERKLAEVKLADREQRLRMALDSGGMGTWDWDPVADRSYWDEPQCRMLGLPPDTQGSYEGFLSVVHPDDRAAAAAAIEQSAQVHAEFDLEFRIIKPDGEVRWLAGKGSGHYDESGQLTRMGGVNYDITDHKRVQDAVVEAETARRANLAKTEFLSRMSHELRTPLNAVLGFAQLLRLDPTQPLAPEQRERVNLIERAGRHQLAMINDVLDLSIIESGRVMMTLKVLDVFGVVKDSVALVHGAAAEAGIAMAFEADGTGPLFAVADAVRLRQVLTNLLTNAIKYNCRDGRVEVACGALDSAAWIAVADTGRGLTTAQIQHLYEPFNRLGAERSAIEGTGIGLVIARRLIEQMQGRIEVQSEVGRGSRFTVWLQGAATAAASAGAGEEAAAAAGARRRRSVLYVEDDAVNTQLVEWVFTLRPDLSLCCVADGHAALAAVRDAAPDLLLVDMHLPDMSGLELLAALRADATAARIPCIALSADAVPEFMRRARAAGFVDYLTKPFEIDALLRSIDSALDRA